MTEEEWLSSTDETPILEFLLRKGNHRKLCLFAVAAFREIEGIDDTSTGIRGTLVAVTERFVDGLADSDELFEAVGDYFGTARAAIDEYLQGFSPSSYAWAFCESPLHSWLSQLRYDYKCSTLRDILGNPFRPVAFDPEWRTTTVVLLARGMYESRDFSAVPILADALQDAGCENADILTHCRDTQLVHDRGCWVVDGILEKS